MAVPFRNRAVLKPRMTSNLAGVMSLAAVPERAVSAETEIIRAAQSGDPEAFERLVAQGKIRAYAISTDSVAVAEAFNREGNCAAVQLNFSLLNPAAADALLPWCAANDVGTLLRGPIAQGLLAGKFTAETHFDDSVRMGWNEGAAHARFLAQVAKVEQLRFLERPDRTLAQAALQWTLAQPGVTCAIPGAKNVAQITSNAQAADGTLTAEERDHVTAVMAGW